MTLTYNRQAFSTASETSGVPPLVSAYNSLVGIELFLKQRLPPGTMGHHNGHNVPSLLHALGAVLQQPHGPTIQALTVNLGNAISQLWCDKFGKAANIPADKYPYMRYIRHASEYPTQNSTDEDIENLIKIISQVKHKLYQATGTQL